MELTIYKTDGTSSKKKAQLSDSIFAIEPNETVLYEDVRRIQANSRQGTAKTKERGEVRGGGKKAYKQKGTGMARRGSIRSPLLKGGGTVFGPRPRTYTVNLSKKAKRLARKSALSLKVSEESLVVVEDFSYEAPKTKQVVELLTALKLDGKKVLLLTSEMNKNIFISARNIPGVSVLEASKPSTYEIMKADVVIFQESAVSVLENSIEPKVDEEAA
ncbi:50S ribosomal protein L4 [Rhodohalobacter barkolensis]|uniref:Large ribosomal subunit protein uL4 n=1 Tax=Rhodohalobacter barkolensis TaxID=2053187 RepID=A0A2N0VFJ1_9BACT|nr:50S ribosomal protein L4 [Rhodohalobacter barkolensis]PKD42959.1 50S ribosomal protein L4 [Rhodohalobacter barkolensis]